MRTLQSHPEFSKRSLTRQNLAVLESANFTNRFIQTSLLGIFVFVIFISFAKADSFQLWCVPAGQSVNFSALCNPAMSLRNGPINVCMHLLDNGKVCPTNLNFCNALDLTCSSNANTTLDTTPPNLTINSPANNGVYTEKSVLLNLRSSKTSDIYFTDNLNSPRVWSRVCKDCSSYSKKKNFKEGINDLLFRVADRAGNEVFQNLTFFIDTKVPQIKSVLPKTGFTSGLFTVEFLEANPKNLTIKYGNGISGMRNLKVNLTSCADGASGRKICEVQTNLTSFDNQQIELWAELIDIAGNVAVSPHNFLDVDFSNPIIKRLDYPVNGKNVNFRIELNESHPDRIAYKDNSENSPSWKNLCSGMKSNVCEKKVSFNDGAHDVSLKITDLAGNSIQRNVSFFTDSKKPKIKGTSPKSGFMSGEFEVEFDEANPESLVLHYGNVLSGMRETALNISKDCIFDTTYKCLKNVNLNDYNSEQIGYHFDLEDVVGQATESKHVEVSVDTTFPVINSVTHTLSGNKAAVTIAVTEQNLDKITYINNADAIPAERTFCSILIGGMCKKTITLRPGVNELNFQVYDKAGNSVGRGHEIDL